jgi:hypothetical protein
MKIVCTEGTIKVLLPEYQVYKCVIILNNCAITNSKLGPLITHGEDNSVHNSPQLKMLNIFFLLYFSYFFLYKFYGNKNTISIVSFNLSEKYYSYQVYKCVIILNNCAITNSKLGPFLMDF